MNQRLFWVDAPHTFDYEGEVYPTMLFISEKIPCDRGELHLKIERINHCDFETEITLYLTAKDGGDCQVVTTSSPFNSLDMRDGKEEAEILLFSHIDSNGKFIERPNR